MRFTLSLGLVLGLALAAPAFAADTTTGEQWPLKRQEWSFEGVFGKYDQTDLQHGFQVYKEVCSACHSLNRVAFHTLSEPGGPGFSEAQMKAIAAGYQVLAGPNDKGETTDDKGNPLKRPGIPADYFPPPFPNENAARASNGGALPPDLSLIVAARNGGPDYVFSILTGFHEKTPDGFKVTDGKYFNPYFPGWNISMPPPLQDGQVTFNDWDPKKKATVADEAYAVANFLAWTSEPHLDDRHRIGVGVMVFLIVLSGLLYLSYRQVWKDAH
ncbi:MAG: cytochrome c1 [Alphaproteobacteria bacterium]|nr:cytochrome c1 [Alphaproteobacteria bacterium]MBL6938612.1 cytochrome c1 [Alphaproteobacteria bacterium]MBL7098031.1 cytochrome c1 [Alphaproteobacteria bacterium]